MTGRKGDVDLSALLSAIDHAVALNEWDSLCRKDGILGSGSAVATRIETLTAFIDALSEPYEFQEEIEELAHAASDVIRYAGTAGLATRQLLALGETLARIEVDGYLREEFDRRLRVVLGRFVLYVNVAALREADLQAHRDALTGLRNRLAFDHDLDGLVDNREAFCIAVIDVDGLKRVNDSDGHEAGDNLLRRVGRALADTCAGGDYAYRFGGDEFAYLSTVRAGDDVQRLMEELSKERTPFSWGIAEYPDEGSSPTFVKNLADRRMYKLKRTRKRVRTIRLLVNNLLNIGRRLWRRPRKNTEDPSSL